jgi:hypothetical protein
VEAKRRKKGGRLKEKRMGGREDLRRQEIN